MNPEGNLSFNDCHFHVSPVDNSSLLFVDSPTSLSQMKPTKTLEQREADYAEARLRILGQAYVSSNPNSKDAAGNPSQSNNQLTNNSQATGGVGAAENGVQTKADS